MKDRVPTHVLENGAIRYGVYDEDGNLLRYEYIKAEDSPSQIGTPLNKTTLLKDETATKLGLTQNDPTVDDAFNGLFQSVSDGKELVASAITDKGVTTAPDATFQTMSENIEKISTIPPDVHTVTLSASPADGGTVAGGGYASKNMNIRVDALAAKDYKFLSWKKGNSVVSNNANYIFPVSSNVSLTAQFEKKKLLGFASATLPFSANWASIAYGNGKFVAISSDGKGVYSTDAVNWEVSNIQVTALSDICFGNGKFVAVGSGYRAYYSADGITWTAAAQAPRINLYAVAYGNGKFVAVGSHVQDGRYMDAAYSTDGSNWVEISMPKHNSNGWRAIGYGGGKFVAFLDYSNNSAYSEDGTNWTLSAYPPANSSTAYWGDVTYGSNKFVTVWDGGTSWSDDGAIWRVNGDGYKWESVVYGNGMFAAVGFPYKLGYSLDGETWDYESLGGDLVIFNGIAFGAGKFVIVGNGNGGETSNKILYFVS